MHGKHIFFRKEEVLHREHRFLHLAGIAHTRNEHFALTKVDDDSAVRVGSVPLGIADKVGDIHNLPLRLFRGVVVLGPNEHVATKQTLPCGARHNLHRYVVVVMLSYVEMLHPLLTGGEMRLHTIPQRIKGCCIELAVDAAPLDRFFARGLSNDISVRWRPTRPVSCLDAKCAGICQTTLFPV